MDINYNTYCYHFETLEYDKGFLDECVDATYIIHLEDNGRYDHIKEQLTIFQPTKNVYIAHNAGFTKCKKRLIDQISYQDLSDAFLQCFNHANDHGYNNVLILEDDFIFNPEIKKRENIETISTFLKEKEKEEQNQDYKNSGFIYYLGCNPIIVYPCSLNLKHYKSIKSMSMHSIIYSRSARDIKKMKTNLKHWDVIVENSIKNRYLYYKPLCYQTYPDTDNKKSWSEKDGSIIISYIKLGIIQLLNLDKEYEPGFSIIYGFSKLLFLLFVIGLIILIYKLVKHIVK